MSPFERYTWRAAIATCLFSAAILWNIRCAPRAVPASMRSHYKTVESRAYRVDSRHVDHNKPL